MLKAWNFTKINSAKHALIIIQGKVSKQYSQERLRVDTFESYFNVRFMFGQFRQLFVVNFELRELMKMMPSLLAAREISPYEF